MSDAAGPPGERPFLSPRIEAEIRGRLLLPPGRRPLGRIAVFASEQDCLDPQAPLLGVVPAEGDRFFLEVFPLRGASVTLCAAVAPPGGRPATLYGRAEHALAAVGEREVQLGEVLIPLRVGPPRRFSFLEDTPRPGGPPAARKTASGNGSGR